MDEQSHSAESVGRRVAKGALLMIGARFSMRGIGLLSTVIIARLLQPSDFGLVSLSAATLAAVEVFGNFGFELALISDQGSSRDHYDTVWTLTIARGAFVALVLTALAVPASDFFRDPRMAPILYALAMGSLLESFQNVGVVDFRKQLNFSREFAFMIGGKLSSFCVTVTLAVLWRNYWALVAGMVSGRIGGVALSYLMCSYRPRFALAEWRALFGFSKWMFLTNLMTFFGSKLDTFTIGRVIGAHAVGLYEISFEIANLPTGELVLPIQRALFPGYARIAKDRSELARSFVGGLSVILLIALPAASGIILLAKPLVLVFLGPRWVEAIPILQVLAIAGAVRICQGNISSVLLALGKTRSIGQLSSFGFSSLLICVLVGVWQGGTIGVAWGLIASYAITISAMFFVSLRTLGLRFTDIFKATWRTFVAVSFMGVCVGFVDHSVGAAYGTFGSDSLKLAFLSLIGAAVYLAVHLALWGLSGYGAGPEQAIARFLLPTLSRWGGTAVRWRI